MTKFILTRHGQTVFNLQRRMQGQGNSDLTELGIAQAQALGIRLKDIDFDFIVSSNQGRAMDTTKILVGNKKTPVEFCSDITEINIGDWSGMSFLEAEEKFPEQTDNFWHHPADFVPPMGGETYEQVRERAANKLKSIAKEHPHSTVLVVSHGIVIKSLLSFFRNQPISTIADAQPHPQSCCYCEVAYEDGVWNIYKWNDIDHYKFINPALQAK